METQPKKDLSKNDLFEDVKEKFNLIVEIFSNKEFFFQDEILKKFFSKRRTKLSDEKFAWLKNRVKNLKLNFSMSNKCEHPKLKRTFHYVFGNTPGFISREPHTCTICGEEIVREFKNGATAAKYDFKQEFVT